MPKRLPLATPLQSRDGTLAKDSGMVNAFAEMEGSQATVFKRPGLTESFDLTSGTGQGMINWKGTLYSVRSETVTQGPTASPVADGTAWTQYSVTTGPTIAIPHPQWTFDSSTNTVWALGRDTPNRVFKSVNLADFTEISPTGYSARTYFSLAFYDSKLWLFGGYAGGYLGDTYSSTDGTTWTQVTASAPWTARSRMTAVTFNGIMYMFGGEDSIGKLAELWKSSDALNWTQVTGHGISARIIPWMVVHDSKLWIIGGIDVSNNGLQDVYSSTNGTTWVQVTANGGFGTTTADDSASLVSYNNKLWLIGLGTATGRREVWSSTDGATWTQVTASGAFSAYHPKAVVIDSNLYLCPSSSDKKYWLATNNTAGGTNYALTGASGTAQIDMTSTSGAASTEYLFLKNTADAWALTYGSPGTLTAVSDADYPATTVPGVAYLDGYFFVMDADAQVWNSELNTPFTWLATSFVTADTEPDAGIAIAKHLDYIVAFCDHTTTLFYNAGNATGSPLLPLGGTAIMIGCANGYSVQNIDGGLFFMSKTQSLGRSVHFFPAGSTTPQEIADEDIQRILNAQTLTTVRSWSARLNGHAFYFLNLVSDGITLVYDLTSKFWSKWTYQTTQSAQAVTSITQSGGVATVTMGTHGFADGDPILIAGATPSGYNGTFNITKTGTTTFTYPVSSALSTPATGTITATGYTEGYFPFSYFTSSGGKNYVQHESNGKIYEISPSYTDDDGQHIDWRVRTSKLDLGSNSRKSMAILDIVGDKVSANMYVRYSDDDYTTYSDYRPVDLSVELCRLTRLGGFVRRVLEFRHTASTRLRVASAEVEINGK